MTIARAIVAAAFMLAAAWIVDTAAGEADAATRDAGHNHYAISSAQQFGWVFVLNTDTGQVRHCQSTTDLTAKPACTPWSD